MIPPLALLSISVFAVIQIGSQILNGRVELRPCLHLSAEPEVVHVALPAVWTVEQE
jgi:hypothetical protein